MNTIFQIKFSHFNLISSIMLGTQCEYATVVHVCVLPFEPIMESQLSYTCQHLQKRQWAIPFSAYTCVSVSWDENIWCRCKFECTGVCLTQYFIANILCVLFFFFSLFCLGCFSSPPSSLLFLALKQYNISVLAYAKLTKTHDSIQLSVYPFH